MPTAPTAPTVPPAPAARAGRAWAWRVIAVGVLLAYNTWLLVVPVNGRIAIMNGYLSELAASDQPHNLFFRLGDGLTAVLVMIIGLVALVRWPGLAAVRGSSSRRLTWWRVSAVFLIFFAIATGVDAISSMDCSPTLSAACAVAERTGSLSIADHLHTLTSVSAQLGICGSMIAAVLAERPPYVVARRRQLWVVTVVEVVALVIMMIMLVVDAPGLGYAQAVMVLLASVWFALAAASLSRGAVPLPSAVDPDESRRRS